jgi:hypothetical protein
MYKGTQTEYRTYGAETGHMLLATPGGFKLQSNKIINRSYVYNHAYLKVDEVSSINHVKAMIIFHESVVGT